MKGQFLLGLNKTFVEGNIYADKSSIILDWLLRVGIDKKNFSLREVVKDRKVSLGLVQRVFGTLILHNLLQTEGVRTSKKFFLRNPDLLLKSWLEQYSIVKKCKMWTYRSGFQNKEEMLNKLKQSSLSQKIALSLHSAAEGFGCKNTNLHTLELYMLNTDNRQELEKALQLEPQERGYEVLLIEPYYKSLLQMAEDIHENIKLPSALLTFLDLYHFPLRGQEQAEFMINHISELKRIYKKG